MQADLTLTKKKEVFGPFGYLLVRLNRDIILRYLAKRYIFQMHLSWRSFLAVPLFLTSFANNLRGVDSLIIHEK